MPTTVDPVAECKEPVLQERLDMPEIRHVIIWIFHTIYSLAYCHVAQSLLQLDRYQA